MLLDVWRCRAWLDAWGPDKQSPVFETVLPGLLKGKGHLVALGEAPEAVFGDDGMPYPAPARGLGRVDHAEAFVVSPLPDRPATDHDSSIGATSENECALGCAQRAPMTVIMRDDLRVAQALADAALLCRHAFGSAAIWMPPGPPGAAGRRCRALASDSDLTARAGRPVLCPPSIVRSHQCPPISPPRSLSTILP
jgi:hypothetical protein